MADKSYRSFKVKQSVSPKVMLSIVIAVVGLLSLIFLAGSGIHLTYAQTTKGTTDIALGNCIWGGGTYGVGLSAGLIVAFFLTIAASLFVLGVGGFQYIALLSMLMFIAAGVLTFCAVPLCADSVKMVGKGVFSLGWGSYAYGIVNCLLGVACYFCTRGD